MKFAEIVKGINVTAVVTVGAVVIGGVVLYYKLKNIKSTDPSIDDNGTVEDDYIDEPKFSTKVKQQKENST